MAQGEAATSEEPQKSGPNPAWLGKLTATFQGPRKWEAFLGVVVGVLVVSSIASYATKKILFQDNAATRPVLAVVADDSTTEGRSISRGAQMLVAEMNAIGGYHGRQIEALVIKRSGDGVKSAIASGRLVAAVGQVDAEAVKAFEAAKIPVESIAVAANPNGKPSLYALNPIEEARFVANYSRNIVQSRIAYVVREDGKAWEDAAQTFSELYAKFDTPVQKEFVIEKKDGKFDVASVVAELKKLDFGSIYLASSPELGAEVVAAMRKQRVPLDVIGTSTLSSGAFQERMTALVGADAGAMEHGIMAASPILFDTAGEGAQRFQETWQKTYQTEPDWMAALGRDAALKSLETASKDVALPKMSKIAESNGVSLPVQIGIYSGTQLVSAPVQLLPMPQGASYDYMEALKTGKVLYVNDRFMFKSNVVYAGMTVNDISDVDTYGESANIDFTVWFRFKGAFDPKDLVFDNALEQVKFAEPEESNGASAEVKYRKYRTKAKFKLNFTDERRAYGQHIAGIQFRHKTLNQSNMIFVSDVQGMPSGSALGADMEKRRVAKPASGWRVDGAWMSQSVQNRTPEGAPQYIGNTGEKPQFSTITLATRLKQDSFSPLGSVNHEWLVYLIITGLVGLLAAKALDARQLGRFMSAQSWLLRVIFLPCLVVGFSAALVDYCYSVGTLDFIKVSLFASGSAWWVLGAYLSNMAVKRFVWEPLEARANKRIPNAMKSMVGFIIYLIAICGIVAVVLDKSMTSILAASGIVALVVGTAIKANIANVFSGVILNIERPFRVGDFVKIGSIVGEVKDITWRTIRMESGDGTMLIMANSKVSEANMENLSHAPNGIAADTTFSLPHSVDPKQVTALIDQAAMGCKSISLKDNPDFAPKTRYKGLVKADGGGFVAQFVVGYRVKFAPKKSAAREELWLALREKFIELGIPMVDESLMAKPAKT